MRQARQTTHTGMIRDGAIWDMHGGRSALDMQPSGITEVLENDPVVDNSMQLTSIEQVMKYEQGEMDTEEMVEFFQALIDSGLAWTLQGHYGRQAAALIDAGYCFAAAQHKKVG